MRRRGVELSCDIRMIQGESRGSHSIRPAGRSIHRSESDKVCCSRSVGDDRGRVARDWKPA